MKKLLTTCAFLAVAVVGFALSPKPAEAATIPLNGYAWSENIGWIHFKGSNYGVIVDSVSGAMSGNAWSENLGWLSFNSSDLTGCPSGACSASLNIQSGAVTGWAKFLSSGEWVHLSGSGYGVTYNNQSNEFSGYAWSDTNAGWIKWKNTSPAYVVISESPIVPPPSAPTNLTATAISNSRIDLAWTDNSTGETGFKIERKQGAAGTYAEITTTNPNVTSYQNSTGLTHGTLYYYRVRATNNGGDSGYSNEASTSTLPLAATINVNIEPNTASWTINPGSIERTGDQSIIVNPSGSGTTYTLTPGSAPSGYDFPPAISNSQGGGSSMTLFDGGNSSFTVTYTRSFNYSLSNGGNMNVQKGGGSYVAYGQTTVTRTLAPDSGPTQSVDLSVSGLPSGVTVNGISNNPCSPNCTSTVTLAVSSSATAGTYPITVTGTPLGRTTQFNLIITNSPDIFVSCTHDPSGAEVGQTVEWTANVTQTPSEAPYTFYWSGTNVPTEPAPTTQSFDISYSTTGLKSVDVIVTDSKGNTATCNPDGSINIGVDPSFEEF